MLPDVQTHWRIVLWTFCGCCFGDIVFIDLSLDFIQFIFRKITMIVFWSDIQSKCVLFVLVRPFRRHVLLLFHPPSSVTSHLPITMVWLSLPSRQKKMTKLRQQRSLPKMLWTAIFYLTLNTSKTCATMLPCVRLDSIKLLFSTGWAVSHSLRLQTQQRKLISARAWSRMVLLWQKSVVSANLRNW